MKRNNMKIKTKSSNNISLKAPFVEDKINLPPIETPSLKNIAKKTNKNHKDSSSLSLLSVSSTKTRRSIMNNTGEEPIRPLNDIQKINDIINKINKEHNIYSVIKNGNNKVEITNKSTFFNQAKMNNEKKKI